MYLDSEDLFCLGFKWIIGSIFSSRELPVVLLINHSSMDTSNTPQRL